MREKTNPKKFKPVADRLVGQDAPIEKKIVIFARHIQQEIPYGPGSTHNTFSAYSHRRGGNCQHQAKALLGLLQSHGIESTYREDKETSHATVIIPHPAGNIFIDYYLSNKMGIRTPNLSWRIQKDGTVSVRKRKGAATTTHPLDKLLQEIFDERP